MSLRGKTVVVTRAAAQASELADLLIARGATIVLLPSLVIAPPRDPRELERAAKDGAYDWIVLVSKNAAERLLAVPGVTLGAARIAAVGPKTAAFVEARGIAVERVPSEHNSEALLEALGDVAGQRILVPRSPEGRPALIEGLQGRGARVDAPEAYRLDPPPPAAPDVVEAAARADVLTFLSGRTLELFLDSIPDARRLLDRATVAVIGPVALAAAERLGVRIDVVPREATALALVDALDVL